MADPIFNPGDLVTWRTPKGEIRHGTVLGAIPLDPTNHYYIFFRSDGTDGQDAFIDVLLIKAEADLTIEGV